jgi:Fur family ferric uptake transcriptional regulator
MNPKDILGDYALKLTSCRQEVLQLFLERSQALGQADIEKEVDPTHDRVTVYRTIKTFLDKGILHKVLDDAGITKYALCNECAKNNHNHEHVHFKCEKCGQTLCLEKTAIPSINLPKGYIINEKYILIQGICASCGGK